MSGIAGIVSPVPTARARIRDMVASMAHRGPDGMHVDIGDDAALGHCAMHTTPEAEWERFPLRHPETGVLLTADARIDNREELIRKLDLRRDLVTDADLILHAYLKWGRSAPEHLIGDFVFAVWDPRTRTLFAARDHIGVRPLYYHIRGEALYFASEIKAIRAGVETSFEINEDFVAEYLTKELLSPDATFFARIQRLPAAHSLTFHIDGTYEVERYWELDPERETVFASDEEYEEAFRELFSETVRCRMRTNNDFAILLSGGLDSSSVACVETSFEINEDFVAEYLTKELLSPDATFFARIQRLPAAHSLTFHIDGTYEVERYWELDPERETVFASDEEYEEAFRELFSETVRCRMRTNNDFAILLSGGLDSSSVACVARDINQQNNLGPISTYTAQFGYDKADESEYLQALNDQGGFLMHDVNLHGVDPLAEIDKAIYHLDQPPLMGNGYVRYHCHRGMVADGTRVLLDGSEGDITVSYGLGRLGEMVLAGDWTNLEYEVQALSRTTGASVSGIFRQNVSHFLPGRFYHHPIRFTLRESGIAARLQGSARARILYRAAVTAAASRMRSRRDKTPLPDINPLMSIEFARQTRIAERLAARTKSIGSDVFSDRTRHYRGIHEDSPAISAIREEGNHLAAFSGGESRHPFFDVRLIEHCVSLPSNQKLRDGFTRSIQRRALVDTLPPNISARMSKGNLSQNFVNIIRADSGGKIKDMLHANRQILTSYFNLEYLHQATSSGNVMPLWTAFTFLEWHRTVFNSAPAIIPDGNSTASVEATVSY